MINPFDADVTLGSLQVLADAQGRLEMSGVLPGRYVITSGCQKSLYVKSARFRNGSEVQDLLDAGLDLRNATNGGSVEVLLGKDSAVVTGMIKDDDQASRGRYVTLIPDSPLPGETLHFRSGMTDEGGRFNIARVAPGNYQLYAWVEPISSLVLVDQKFLARFQGESKKVAITAGAQDIGIWKTVKP